MVATNRRDRNCFGLITSHTQDIMAMRHRQFVFVRIGWRICRIASTSCTGGRGGTVSDGLIADDLRRTVEVVRELNEDRNGSAGWLAALHAFGRLIGCEEVVAARVDVDTREVVALDNPPTEHTLDNLPRVCPLVIDQHPGFRAYRSGRLPRGESVAVTDLVDTSALRRTPLYAEVMKPRGVADELLCSATVSDQQDIVLVVSRATHGFSARDRALIGLIAPHVAQNAAWRQRTETTQWTTQSGDDPSTSGVAWSALTPREHDVSALVLRGATDREIARSLIVSTRTVHKHLEHIYRKLDVTNRTSLVALLTGPRS
jgi:DNA-binding CsgD family transcriptional regulator